MPRVQIEVNGMLISVKVGATVLQACEAVGIEIPRFCYHERLLVAGNCRMCLVEVVGAPKPQAACALPVTLGPGGAVMKIVTDSPMVKKAREGVREMLLVNHPLDCPICDQGGECDLQDQSNTFGSDRSRMFEAKRSVEDKDRGPLVKTVMTRCIHCTRCIRFSSEIAGVADLGTSARGRETEVGTYVEKVINSERSGNLIDLCPVGALTSKPFAFKARSLELESVETTNARDAFGASIKIQTRGDEVLRARPVQNDDLNGELLDDKSRFSIDGLHSQRITSTYVAKAVGNNKELLPVAPEVAIKAGSLIRSDSKDVKVLVSGDVSLETMSSAKARVNGRKKKGIKASIEGLGVPVQEYAEENTYVFDTEVRKRSEADVVLLIGTDPRKESPLLNVKLREGFLRGTLKVYSIGNMRNLTYPVENRGPTLNALKSVLDGKHPVYNERVNAKKPVIIIGGSVRLRKDQLGIRNHVQQRADTLKQGANFSKGLNVVNVLHHRANTAGLMMCGINGFSGFKNLGDVNQTTLILVGITKGELKELGYGRPKAVFKYLISMGSHGDNRRAYSDVLLPLPTFVETHEHWVNTEGKVQSSKKAATKAFGEIDHDLFNRIGERRGRDKESAIMDDRKRNTKKGSEEVFLDTALVPVLHDYYTEGHVVARVSSTMSDCSKTFKRGNFRE